MHMEQMGSAGEDKWRPDIIPGEQLEEIGRVEEETEIGPPGGIFPGTSIDGILDKNKILDRKRDEKPRKPTVN